MDSHIHEFEGNRYRNMTAPASQYAVFARWRGGMVNMTSSIKPVPIRPPAMIAKPVCGDNPATSWSAMCMRKRPLVWKYWLICDSIASLKPWISPIIGRLD